MSEYRLWWKEGCTHATWRECSSDECCAGGYEHCPYGEPLHFHHDGCPCCSFPEDMPDKGAAVRVAYYGGHPED